MAAPPARVGPHRWRGVRTGVAGGAGISAALVARAAAARGWGAAVEMAVVCALAIAGVLWLALRDRRPSPEAVEARELP